MSELPKNTLQSERADTVNCAQGRHGKPVRLWRFYIENLNYVSHQLHLHLHPPAPAVWMQNLPADLSTRRASDVIHSLQFCNLGVLFKSQTENQLGTPSFLRPDQSFQSIGFADLAWCKNLNAEQTGWESLMNNKY